MPPLNARMLIIAHFCISLGGLLLHLRIHPLQESLFNWWAIGFAGLNVFVLPILFWRPTTTALAYMLNAATVVVGTVGMAYYSLINEQGPVTANLVLLQSTFPDIAILWAKLPLAHVILREMRPLMQRKERRGCR